MRIAKTTISEVKTKTCAVGLVVEMPTTAMPAQAMPLNSSRRTNLRRHATTSTSARGKALNV